MQKYLIYEEKEDHWRDSTYPELFYATHKTSYVIVQVT